jgi:serine/threonine protein kinase
MGAKSSKNKHINDKNPPRKKPELQPAPTPPYNRFATIPDIKAQYVVDYNEVLGSGAFGKVYGGHNTNTGVKFAVKIVNKKALKSSELKLIENEAIILSDLEHPNIIKYYYITDNVNYLNIYMEYFSGGDIFNYVNKYEYINECNTYNIFSQLLDAVEYLHDNEIIHRDIKLDNMLFNRTENTIRVVLTDFGLSIKRSKSDPLLTTPCGSPLYVAPEILAIKPNYNGYASDIWASGVVLYTLLVGSYPFNDDGNLYQNIKACNPHYPRRISQECTTLLQNIFIYDQNQRITIHEIRQSSWFTFWDNNESPCPKNLHNPHKQPIAHTTSFSNLSTGSPYHNINQSYPSNSSKVIHDSSYYPPLPPYEPPLPPSELPESYDPPFPPYDPPPPPYEQSEPPFHLYDSHDHQPELSEPYESNELPEPSYPPPPLPSHTPHLRPKVSINKFNEEMYRYFNEPLRSTPAKLVFK